MVTKSRSLVSKEVDRLFAKMTAKPGEVCDNPVTGIGFAWEENSIGPQKEEACRALLAREHFALNGPSDALPLPLSYDAREQYRKARGLAGVVGFYARSLSPDYDISKHPPFYDYACGLLAQGTGLWGLEKDPNLLRRFPPRSLKGMISGGIWEPPAQCKNKIKRAA
jgi:hypothetical protein